METKIIEKNRQLIASVSSDELLITDGQSALDLIASVVYDTDALCIAVSKVAITEGFFDLKTRIAGEVLQKFINYGTKLAIYGNFSMYTSKALADFIYERNKGRHIFFAASEDEAVERLAKAR